MVVRDPLLDYGGDPAELLSQRLENRVLAGRSGMLPPIPAAIRAPISALSAAAAAVRRRSWFWWNSCRTAKAKHLSASGRRDGLERETSSGDVAIASGVVRDEGMTSAYVTSSYPAVCSYELVACFVKGCPRS